MVFLQFIQNSVPLVIPLVYCPLPSKCLGIFNLWLCSQNIRRCMDSAVGTTALRNVLLGEVAWTSTFGSARNVRVADVGQQVLDNCFVMSRMSLFFALNVVFITQRNVRFKLMILSCNPWLWLLLTFGFQTYLLNRDALLPRFSNLIITAPRIMSCLRYDARKRYWIWTCVYCFFSERIK